jgi:UDP-glucose 4-epimerase
LLARGTPVRILDNLSTGSRESLEGLPVDLRVADLTDAGQVRDAVRGIQTIFHLAAMISAPGSMENPIGCYQPNVLGSLNVLEASRRERVGRVVLSSYCAVYGDSPARSTETSEAKPLSPYAASKLAMEDLARLYHSVFGVETVCLRYFNVYGPRQNPRSAYAAVIPLFIDAMLKGQPPTIFGDGRQSRDFVFVEDVVQANLLAADAPSVAGHTFNIGRGASVTVRMLADMLQALIPGAPPPVFAEARPGDIRLSAGDIQAATQALGYRPAYDLQQGLQATVEWSRAAGPPAATE